MENLLRSSNSGLCLMIIKFSNTNICFFKKITVPFLDGVIKKSKRRLLNVRLWYGIWRTQVRREKRRKGLPFPQVESARGPRTWSVKANELVFEGHLHI